MRIPVIGDYSNGMIVSIYVVAVLLVIPEMKVSIGDLLFLILSIFFYTLSPFLFPGTITYWEQEAYRFLVGVLPLYFVGVYIGRSSDLEDILSLLYKLSVATIILRIAYFCFRGTPMTEVQSLYEGDMDGAYNLLPHLCLVMYYTMKRKSVFRILVLSIGSAFLLFLGTRGAVLMEIVCCVLLMITSEGWKKNTMLLLVVAIFAIAVIFSPLFKLLIYWLQALAETLGLSIRIFDKILSGQLSLSSGRDMIADSLFDALRENWLGYGIYGDRVIVNTYAHNIVLEMWIQFGVFLGTLLCACVIMLPVRAFLKTKNVEMKGFLIVLYCTSVLKLFLSGSYLHERLLTVLLGVCSGLLHGGMKIRKIRGRHIQ